jgi:hypothetical protein
LVGQLRDLYEEVWTRDPGQRPEWAPPVPQIELIDPPDAQATMPRPTRTPELEQIDAPDESSTPARELLARQLWDDVGLFEARGVVTHGLGDEHAQKILTGEIAFEDARVAHEAARHRAEQFTAFYE